MPTQHGRSVTTDTVAAARPQLLAPRHAYLPALAQQCMGFFQVLKSQFNIFSTACSASSAREQHVYAPVSPALKTDSHLLVFASQHVLLNLPGQSTPDLVPWFEQNGVPLNWCETLLLLHHERSLSATGSAPHHAVSAVHVLSVRAVF
jgi:hypothetical protein